MSDLETFRSAGCQGWHSQEMPPGSLSLCMIVRDEEKLLGRCLQSVEGIVDELIVVDTGSRDKTVAIAESFGARVFHYTWQDDFASARNHSLYQATAQWILILDADEMATESFRQHIRPFLLTSDASVVQCVLEDHYDRSVILEPIFRLFRNIPGVHYVRSYHEMLNFRTVKTDQALRAAYRPDLLLFHDGYLREHIQRKDKVARALKIMGQYLETHPDDYYILSKLAQEVSDQELALELSQRALDSLNNQPESDVVQAYEVHLIYASIRMRLQRLEEACGVAEKAVEMALPDVHKTTAFALLAQIYTQQGKFAQSRTLCQYTLPHLPDHYGLNMAWGWTLQHDGEYQEALAAYERAVKTNPEDAFALRCVATMLIKIERPSQAIPLLERAIALESTLPTNFYELGRAYSLSQRLLEAQEAFEKAISLCISEAEEALKQDCQNFLVWTIENLKDNWPSFYNQGGVFPASTKCFDWIRTFLVDRQLSVLELGSGTGLLANTISDQITGYLGVDISAEALQYLQFCGLETLETNVDEPLPLGDATYSCVIATHLLEYTSKAEQVIQEAFRVLQVGGWLILATNMGLPLPGMPRPLRIYDREGFMALIQTVAEPEYIWLNYCDEQFLDEQGEKLIRPVLVAFIKKNA
jgi:tetratricopeptide (TPR) repeat protein/ubiquinone/menaquinone biosynthesis C-methylase UbiE